MKQILKSSLLVLVVAAVALGCSKRTVTRVNPDQQIDLSGRWNDTDSRKVANKMVLQFLNSPRHQNFARENGETPAIIVEYIKNKTS